MRRGSPRVTRLGVVAVSLASFGALLGAAPGVRAEQREESKRYRLRWAREGGAEGCVSGAALERLLDRVLTPRAPDDTSQPLLLEGAARTLPSPLKYEIRVSVRDEKTNEVVGERLLTTGDAKCGALTPALLLVLAMSVDPNAGGDGLPASVTEELQRERDEDVDAWPIPPTAPPKIASTSPPVVERAPVAPPPSRAATGGQAPRVFGAFTLAHGVLPAVSSGAELGARIPLRRGWSLSLSALGWLPQTVSLPPSPNLQANGVQIAAGQLRAALCQPLLGSRLQLALCGGFSVGVRWVSALALGTRDNPTRLFYGPVLGVDGTFRVAPSWFVSAGAMLQATLPRDRYTYRDRFQLTDVWYEPPLLAERAFLGVGAYL